MPSSMSSLSLSLAMEMLPNYSRRKRRAPSSSSSSFIERQQQRQRGPCTFMKSCLVVATISFYTIIPHQPTTFEIINGVQAATTILKPFRKEAHLPLAFAQTAPPRPSSSSSDDDDDQSNKSSNNKKPPQRQRRRGNILPLIGPIPNTQPLIPGNSISLDPPTPHQWKSLQESVVVHFNFNIDKEKKDEGQQQATIFAAPLILLIDDVTGKTPVRSPGANAGRTGRYATIAAVVGLSRRDDSTKEEKEEDFLQRMMRPGGSDEEDFITPTKSSVRMVGVGRAILLDYFYKVPSQISEGGEAEYDEEEIMDWENDDSSVHDNEVDYDGGYEDRTPIVMAEFNPLIDTGITAIDEDDFGSKKSKSAMKSEVHAITELNTWVVKVNWMHDNRRRLVAGLNAAKARLRLSEERKRKREMQEIEETEKEVQLKKDEEEMSRSYKEFHPLYDPNMSSIENYKIILQEETKYGLLAVSKRQIEDELMSVVKASGQSVNWETFNILEAMLICTVKRMKELEEQWFDDEDEKKNDDAIKDSGDKREIIEYDDFADYDGFGFIAGGSIGGAESMKGGSESDDEVEETEGGVEGTMTVEEVTRIFSKKQDEDYQYSKSEDTEELQENKKDNGIEKKELSTPAKRIANMENYGLNYYSAFSNIRDLTKVAMQTFEPYFSPLYREREEYEFEILSFVALRALEGYVNVKDIVWALAECVSSTERLERAYQLMLEHRRELEELAEHASDELMDCGEECTDLW